MYPYPNLSEYKKCFLQARLPNPYPEDNELLLEEIGMSRRSKSSGFREDQRRQ